MLDSYVRWFLLCAALGLGVPAAGQEKSVPAQDGVVTIQYMNTERPKGLLDYRGAALLAPKTVSAIERTLPATKGRTWNSASGNISRQSREDLAENYRQVKAVMGQLRDGDVLILNGHSGSKVMGVTTAAGDSATVNWADLFKHYGIEQPPKLGLVILNGCMGRTNEADKEKWDPASDEDLEKVRQGLNSVGLVATGDKLDPVASQKELIAILEGLQGEETGLAGGGRFGSGKIFKLILSQVVDRDKASLAELRFRARELAKKCSVEELSKFRDLVKAVEDEVDPLLVLKNVRVVPWNSRSKEQADGWTPIRFEIKPKREIEKVEIRLKVRTINDIPSTDTFHCRVGDLSVRLMRDFSAYVPKEEDEKKGPVWIWIKPIVIEARSALPYWKKEGGEGTMTGAEFLKALSKTGKLRCCLQDDTILKEAEMEVTYVGTRDR